MASFSLSSLSGTVFHRTFRILADSPINSNPDQPNLNSTRFNPSMAIIIIVLISAFLFLGFFSIYLRRCTSAEEHRNLNGAQQARAAGVGPMPIGSPGQGLDREVVESLPLVGYNLVKDLKGGKELTECAVCLSDFEDDDDLRLLPKCGHVFHPECIDMWFHSHSTCPLCRTTVMPVAGEGKSDATYSEEFQAWVNSRGGGSEDPDAVTIHDGPPVPPNGSILELLSREGADRIMAESLRRDGNVERLDSGLARREGGENGERALEIRALNRALSKNSESFRKASRGVDVSERIGSATFHATDRTSSARFNRSDIGTARFNSIVSGFDGAGGHSTGRSGKKSSRSGDAGQSFNVAALRRSSSVGSSGRFIRQLLGNYADYFSPDSQQDGLRVDRARLLGAQNLSVVENSSRSGSLQIPVWDQIELTGEAETGATQLSKDGSTLRNSVPGVRKSKSQDWPRSPGFHQQDLQGDSSSPLYSLRSGKQNLEERTKSERLTFGQSFRRTFSLRRTFSDSRDSPRDLESGSPPSPPNGSPVGAKWYTHIVPPTSTSSSKVKKFTSPWVAAMKVRRKSASQDEIAMSPKGGLSDTSFPQSLPIHKDKPMPMPDSPPSQRSRPVLDDDRERQLQDRLRHQSTIASPSKESHISPISQPAGSESGELQEGPTSPRSGEYETPPTSPSSRSESIQIVTQP